MRRLSHAYRCDRSVALTPWLWSRWRADGAVSRNSLFCDLSTKPLRPHVGFGSHFFPPLSVSCPQAPATAPFWSTTWPAASCTKNSASIPAKFGKFPVSPVSPCSNTPGVSSGPPTNWWLDLALPTSWIINKVTCWTIPSGHKRNWFNVDCFEAYLTLSHDQKATSAPACANLFLWFLVSDSSRMCLISEQAKLQPILGLTHNRWRGGDGLSQCALGNHGVKTLERPMCGTC